VAVVNNQFDDAVENLKTDAVQRANDEIELKAQFVTALRFRNVPLPEDMEIVDARLTLWVKGINGNDTDASDASVVTSFGMSFEKTGNSEPIMSENRDITSRSLTDSNNGVGGHIVASQTGRWTSNDLKDMLQEVVDETAWESGNALTLLIDVELDGGGLKVQTFESDHPAELMIKYRRKMAPGETPSPTNSETCGGSKSDIPCMYASIPDTAVKYQGTGGTKLQRIEFGSDETYLHACRESCNADPSCGGFVDDPTDVRGRMCKPKTASSGYSKTGKTFYRKGDGC